MRRKGICERKIIAKTAHVIIMKSLILFGGKGGSGKSTTAAATAVFVSEKYKTLLISFDIAHTLSDIFDIPIGDNLTKICNNLFAVEPDPDVTSEKYAGPLLDALKSTVEDLNIHKVFPNLDEMLKVDFLPLGLKNSTFFNYILEYEKNYDVVIADFPPTASMFALIEVPRVHLDQVIGSMTEENRKPVTLYELIARALTPSEIYLRHLKNIVAKRFFKTAKALRKRAIKVNAHLTKASFRLVTLPEKASVKQMCKTAEQFKILGYYDNFNMIYINNVIPRDVVPSGSIFESYRKMQEKYINEVKERFPDKIILEIPKLSFEPVGLENLRKLAKLMYQSYSLEDVVRFE
jgi:arsenite-transporting ATPase